ncbi:MAG: hypothetical protein AAF708_11180 [Deinococcota bacterium]
MITTRRYLQIGLSVGLAFLLAACGEWVIEQSAELNVDISPSQLSYEAELTTSEDGGSSLSFVTPATNSTNPIITLNTRPGSLGVDLEGYGLEYFYADGTPVIPGDSMTMVNDAALPTVPPGIFCEGGEDGPGNPTVPVTPTDPVTVCSVNSPDAVFAPGTPVSFTVVNGVPSRISYELFCDLRPDVGAYARMTIFGKDSLRRDFSLEISSIPITASGSFLVPGLDTALCF